MVASLAVAALFAALTFYAVYHVTRSRERRERARRAAWDRIHGR